MAHRPVRALRRRRARHPPHLAYGAGLAVEDGVILGEELGAAADLRAGPAAFGARRVERCRLVLENGLQILRWEIDPTAPGADPGGVALRSQIGIGAPPDTTGSGIT